VVGNDEDHSHYSKYEASNGETECQETIRSDEAPQVYGREHHCMNHAIII